MVKCTISTKAFYFNKWSHFMPCISTWMAFAENKLPKTLIFDNLPTNRKHLMKNDCNKCSYKLPHFEWRMAYLQPCGGFAINLSTQITFAEKPWPKTHISDNLTTKSQHSTLHFDPVRLPYPWQGLNNEHIFKYLTLY